MTPEQYARLKELFDAAVNLGPAERQVFLANLKGKDRELRDPLREALRAVDTAAPAGDSLRDRLHGLVAATRPVLPPGTVLGRQFEIVRWLAEGGMGHVYQAVDRATNEAIAVKVIRPEIAQVPGILERFNKEVQIAHRLTGPNVCRIHALIQAEPGTAGGSSAFLTMELLDGVTLRKEISSNGFIPWRRALELAADLCDGV